MDRSQYTGWMYICQKLDGADEQCLKNWDSVVAQIDFENEMEEKQREAQKNWKIEEQTEQILSIGNSREPVDQAQGFKKNPTDLNNLMKKLKKEKGGK